MLNNNNFAEEILKVFGWESIPSKNKYMKSYIKEDSRLNHYFTRGTVTIQRGGACSTYRDVFSESQMELAISN